MGARDREAEVSPPPARLTNITLQPDWLRVGELLASFREGRDLIGPLSRDASVVPRCYWCSPREPPASSQGLDRGPRCDWRPLEPPGRAAVAAAGHKGVSLPFAAALRARLEGSGACGPVEISALRPWG